MTWSLFSVLLLWALMIFISILPGETRYLRAPSLSPVRNSVRSFDLFIVVFRFCGKRVKEKQRRAGEGGWGGGQEEREEERTPIPRFFREFPNNFCPAAANFSLKKSALN